MEVKLNNACNNAFAERFKNTVDSQISESVRKNVGALLVCVVIALALLLFSSVGAWIHCAEYRLPKIKQSIQFDMDKMSQTFSEEMREKVTSMVATSTDDLKSVLIAEHVKLRSDLFDYQIETEKFVEDFEISINETVNDFESLMVGTMGRFRDFVGVANFTKVNGIIDIYDRFRSEYEVALRKKSDAEAVLNQARKYCADMKTVFQRYVYDSDYKRILCEKVPHVVKLRKAKEMCQSEYERANKNLMAIDKTIAGLKGAV